MTERVPESLELSGERVDLAQVRRALSLPLAAMSPEVMFGGCFGGGPDGPPLLVPMEQEWLRRVFEQARAGQEG